jgi:hypothetical protein
MQTWSYVISESALLSLRVMKSLAVDLKTLVNEHVLGPYSSRVIRNEFLPVEILYSEQTDQCEAQATSTGKSTPTQS